MRRWNRLIGSFGFFLLVLVALFMYPQPSGSEKEARESLFQITGEEEQALYDVQEYLYTDGGFFEQVRIEMEKAGYEYSIAAMLYSSNDIRVDIILNNIKEISEHQQSEILQIFNDIMIKNHIDQQAFTIQVITPHAL
ncbi:hypothetical protein [Psychrobacillus lasiicapitis]|uniref:Uncharacterized protein n=1 Tax=Psychrobacillus lasiicapitis TaxID=1636719 RepID=A0A544TAR0_9BACI|nr:hypothetical protein [Psychrobacillus lasiicapitis]TQR14561.1 hypothetical protein FG382_08910 [Psychrobacillus lasiicapitis]GGA30361.1 hypothetical protein GCM10011384_19710 [Psychrobacillus lasiicapitis]